MNTPGLRAHGWVSGEDTRGEARWEGVKGASPQVLRRVYVAGSSQIAQFDSRFDRVFPHMRVAPAIRGIFRVEGTGGSRRRKVLRVNGRCQSLPPTGRNGQGQSMAPRNAILSPERRILLPSERRMWYGGGGWIPPVPPVAASLARLLPEAH